MALESAIGSFSKDATGTPSATDVISLSFTPKALILWGDHGVTAEGGAEGDINFSIGFSDGTNNRSLHIWEQSATFDNVRTTSTDRAIYLSSSKTAPIVAGTVTFQTNQFTITWNENGTVASLVRYVALGGTIAVEVGHFTKLAAQEGLQSVPLGGGVQDIKPSRGALLLIGNGNANVGIFDHSKMFLGATDGVTSGTVEVLNQHIADPISSAQGRSTTAITREIWHTTKDIRASADFAGFTPSGFDLRWTINTLNFAAIIPYLVVKGGGWTVSNHTALTSNGKQKTVTSWQPKGVFFFGNRRTDVGVAEESYSLSVGAGSVEVGTAPPANVATSIASTTLADLPGTQTTPELGRFGSNTKCVRVVDGVSRIGLAEASVEATDYGSFELDFAVTDGNAYQFTSVAFGDEASRADALKVAEQQ